jgi:hypothetical protein
VALVLVGERPTKTSPRLRVMSGGAGWLVAVESGEGSAGGSLAAAALASDSHGAMQAIAAV